MADWERDCRREKSEPRTAPSSSASAVPWDVVGCAESNRSQHREEDGMRNRTYIEDVRSVANEQCVPFSITPFF